ncbi:hypothetical protein DFJ58DRAFT_888354 [Suillus subalutaceus]|uniref:uncharacterized protein n=1 Tax=Suillus subalutaceus TaxID=48586 RepID=UPI001B864EAA|nr:uncharacterized protein DFJ58DRAFT_888354 [Suillus subalutaceus]KAG1850221.1 hypothetical protein DFJ58DRAFT_888354 [Suillus subalutaceus]
MDEAIELHRVALALYLSTLPDLDEAIELCRAALILYPLNHFLPTLLFQQLDLLELHLCSVPLAVLISPSLNTLPSGLQTRIELRGVVSDLDEAIELVRVALVFHPPGYSDRFTLLDNLPGILHSRFEQQHGTPPSHLDESIQLHQFALAL